LLGISVNTKCLFCEKSGDIPLRIFYENRKLGWYALLGSPPHTRGHTILVVSKQGRRCPQRFDRDTLGTVGAALSDVVQAMLAYYPVKEVLLASLRREVKHFHIHLVPVWPKEERVWRQATGYSNSHLMEFLGSLEKKRDFLVLERAARQGKSDDEQRVESTKRLQPEIQALRRITGHESSRRKSPSRR